MHGSADAPTLSSIPSDVLARHVFHYLDPESLRNVAAASRALRNAVGETIMDEIAIIAGIEDDAVRMLERGIVGGVRSLETDPDLSETQANRIIATVTRARYPPKELRLVIPMGCLGELIETFDTAKLCSGIRCESVERLVVEAEPFCDVGDMPSDHIIDLLPLSRAFPAVRELDLERVNVDARGTWTALERIKFSFVEFARGAGNLTSMSPSVKTIDWVSRRGTMDRLEAVLSAHASVTHLSFDVVKLFSGRHGNERDEPAVVERTLTTISKLKSLSSVQLPSTAAVRTRGLDVATSRMLAAIAKGSAGRTLRSASVLRGYYESGGKGVPAEGFPADADLAAALRDAPHLRSLECAQVLPDALFPANAPAIDIGELRFGAARPPAPAGTSPPPFGRLSRLEIAPLSQNNLLDWAARSTVRGVSIDEPIPVDFAARLVRAVAGSIGPLGWRRRCPMPAEFATEEIANLPPKAYGTLSYACADAEKDPETVVRAILRTGRRPAEFVGRIRLESVETRSAPMFGLASVLRLMDEPALDLRT